MNIAIFFYNCLSLIKFIVEYFCGQQSSKNGLGDQSLTIDHIVVQNVINRSRFNMSVVSS